MLKAIGTKTCFETRVAPKVNRSDLNPHLTGLSHFEINKLKEQKM